MIVFAYFKDISVRKKIQHN
uniref:Uncharacterized protein n=1 Tax=Lepeophtheirus salmonis TaxID=72036 RepID=A0A0K2TM59_LEPSM